MPQPSRKTLEEFLRLYAEIAKAQKTALYERVIFHSDREGDIPKTNFLSKAAADARLHLGQRSDKKLQNRKGIFSGKTYEDLLEALQHLVVIKDGILDTTILEVTAKTSRSLPESGRLKTDLFFISIAYPNSGNVDRYAYRGLFHLRGGSNLATLEYYRNETEVELNTGQYMQDNGVFYVQIQQPQFKLYTFQLAPNRLEDTRYLHGVFSGTSDGRLVANELLLEHVNSLEEGKTKILKKEPVHPFIRYLLHRRQLTVESGAYNNLDDFQTYERWNNLREFKGVYKGYYLSKHWYKSICECFLVIRDDGTVQLHRYAEAVQNGIAYSRVDNDVQELLLLLKFQTDIKRYRFSLQLRKVPEPKNALKGSFGSEPSHYMPNTGRIVFLPAEPNQLEDSSGLQRQPERYRLTHPAEIIQFKQSEPYSEDIIQFLKGIDEDDFSDDPYQVFSNTEWDMARTAPSIPNQPPALGEPWVGYYKAYIMQYFGNRFVLQSLGVDILPDGKLVFRSLHYDYTGTPLPSSRGNDLLLTAIFKNNESGKQPEIYMCLEKPKMKHPTGAFFSGVYCGVGQMGNSTPQGGRILLFRTNNNRPLPQEECREYGLSRHDPDFQDLLREHPQLLDFFLGFHDDMLESYKSFLEAFVIPATLPGDRAYLQNLTGIYWSYKLDFNREAINKHPLVIYPDGRVLMKSIHPGKVYHGSVRLYGDRSMYALSFHALEDTQAIDENARMKAFYAMSLFTAPGQRSTFHIGMHVSQTLHEHTGLAARQVLRLASANLDDFFELEASEIPIPFLGKATDQDIEQFYDINRENFNLLQALIGEEFNLIRGSGLKTPGKSKPFGKEYDYGLMYFLAGVHLAMKRDPKYVAKVKGYFKQALLHGFNDEALLNRFEAQLTELGYDDLDKKNLLAKSKRKDDP